MYLDLKVFEKPDDRASGIVPMFVDRRCLRNVAVIIPDFESGYPGSNPGANS